MSDIHNLKKRILMDIKQRSWTTSSTEDKKSTTTTLTINDKHAKESSIVRSPRLGSKRFHHIGDVFKSTKEDSTRHPKENSKQTDSLRASTEHLAFTSPSKNKKHSSRHILKECDNNNSSFKKEHKSGSRESLLSINSEKITFSSGKRGFTKSLKLKWDKSKFTTKKKSKNYSEEEQQISIDINNAKDFERQEITPLPEINVEQIKSFCDEDSCEADQFSDLNKSTITRSFSDSTPHKHKKEEDCFVTAETTLLLQRTGSVKTARLRTNRPKLTRQEKIERRVSESDFTRYKKVYQKMSNHAHYAMPRKQNNKPHTENSCMFSKGNASNAFPLLKTKIVEEAVQEDGTVTLRKDNMVKNNRTRKLAETDRDSGVEMDSARSLIRSTSMESTERDSVVEESDEQVTPDSVINTEQDDVENNKEQFDFGALTRSKSHDDILKNDGAAEEAVLPRRASLQETSTIQKRDSEWDMSRLIKNFDMLEWDLSPAQNLKLETLDLDNCDLESIPNTVPEIEYYALREVQAVSLNYNHKIKNGDLLGKLADLRAINMWGCDLERIPPNWATLTKLQMLGLGNNTNLKHFGPMKFLTNIIWLDLGGCGLKQIPDEVTHMMKLRVLALGGNPGIEIGDEICCLWDLKKLGLNNCDLNTIPKSVFSLHKLTHLHLDNNNIRTLGQEIVQLKELKELTVTGNLEICFPKLLSQCEAIECIVVDELKDLTRVSNTLRQRIKAQPAARSPLEMTAVS